VSTDCRRVQTARLVSRTCQASEDVTVWFLTTSSGHSLGWGARRYIQTLISWLSTTQQNNKRSKQWCQLTAVRTLLLNWLTV